MNLGTRSFVLSVVAALAGAIVLDRAYGAYAARHFLPNAILREAEAKGDGCVVTLGDSRMVAAVNAPTLAAVLGDAGARRCIAPLAIGAVPISGSAMALRRFVADGRRPSVVLLGESSGTLLPYVTAPDPAAFFGNRAVELDWSVPSDVRIFYPAFPLGDLDRGIRFSLARANAVETFESATWVKVNAFQERLAGNRHDEPRNRFGTISDMHALLGEFGDDARASLTRFDGRWQRSPWFEMLLGIAQRSGALVVVVEVPMGSSYREAILDLPEARRYREWLAEDLARSGVAFLDLSAATSVQDEDFEDGLHLGAAGAKRFSVELGEALAPILRGKR